MFIENRQSFKAVHPTITNFENIYVKIASNFSQSRRQQALVPVTVRSHEWGKVFRRVVQIYRVGRREKVRNVNPLIERLLVLKPYGRAEKTIVEKKLTTRIARLVCVEKTYGSVEFCF